VRNVIRVIISVAASVTVALLMYPSGCADSGSSPCDTWVGTKVPEFPNVVLIAAILGAGTAVWILLGFTPLGSKKDRP
jgi:hypothetical protein